MIELTGMPMPPSSNRLWERRAGPGQGLKCTDEYEAYKAAVTAWHWQNLPAVRGAQARLQSWLRADPHARLRVAAQFYFQRGHIYCRDGRPKRNDTENRLKALLDAVSGLLEIDDKLFWSGSFDKDVLQPGQSRHSVTMRIELMQRAVARARESQAMEISPAS